MRPLRMALVVSAAVALPSAASARGLQDCELNGQAVNPSNGATYAGKTGIMKCVDRETGQLLREVEYRNGKEIGYRKLVDLWGKTTVGTYNERGNRDGDFKAYDPDGTLTSEGRYANGEAVGVHVSYFKSGQVRSRSYYDPAKGKGRLAGVEYNDRGQLTELRCAAEPLIGEDRERCGFDDKASDLLLYNAKGEAVGRVRYENGVRRSAATLGPGGVVLRSEEADGDRLVVRTHFADGALKLQTTLQAGQRQAERELAPSGQPLRQTTWRDGRVADETRWYLNGQLKSRVQFDYPSGRAVERIEEFWDNGQLRERSQRDARRGYLGLVQRYSEAGVLESELSYEQGRLVRRRDFKGGELVLDEEYFEDGSRKSTRARP